MEKEKIARINELAKKQKTTGLTEAEKAEQQALRKEFIDDFRKNLRGQLENIEIEYPNGKVVDVKERHDRKYGQGEYGDQPENTEVN